MRAKKHVIVLMGGMSAEHDVSLRSGANVVQHLDSDTYAVTAVEITRDGEWVFPDRPGELVEFPDAAPKLKALHPDCVFIALHGPYGEDGRIQGFLDLMGVPYVGAGCAASALALDKVRSKALLEHAGVAVPRHLLYTRRDWHGDRDGMTAAIEQAFGFPCVVKSPRLGSSLGMGIPRKRDELAEVVAEVLRHGYSFMVEEFVHGRELSCGVLELDEDEGPFALPVTEIKPKSGTFFDYHAKYTPGASEEITPAPIPDDIRDEAQRIALCAHNTIGCRGLSRSDMIWSGDRVVWLEINTIPGLTETSLLPQQAAAAGMSLAELYARLVESALI